MLKSSLDIGCPAPSPFPLLPGPACRAPQKNINTPILSISIYPTAKIVKGIGAASPPTNTRIELLSIPYAADIVEQIAKAIAVVSENPRHGEENTAES